MKVLNAILLFVLIIFHSFRSYSQTVDTLVNVGNYKLHFNIYKNSGIPVLFESGGGHDGAVWNEVVKKLRDSVNATLITYDRAGMGKSGIDTNDIDILSEINGLEIALKKLGYTNNILLVAHSFGGVYATLFSARNKNRVKGAVLIDVTLPCYMTPIRAKKATEPYKKELPTIKEKSIGTYYLLVNYEKSIDLLSKTSFPSNIPATVIGADFPPFKGENGILWKSCQKTFGELPRHNYILAEKSGHYIYLDDPELVTNEIIKLYRQTSAKKE
tara:strand:+ start:25371 stop:26186 length:816 start_codon:yes stop_codon:yes gene_type:complete